MEGDMIDPRPSPRREGRALKVIRALASLGLAVLVVLSLSLAIAWPLWSLATANRRAYTIALALLAVASAIAWSIRAGLRAARARSGRPSAPRPPRP
jgi:hypothetical protein